MLFAYHAIDQDGHERDGTIEAPSQDIAITSLQRRNLIISSIKESDGGESIFSKDIPLFNHISNKEVVILSRQLSTLFEAQVSALRVFRLLAAEEENKQLAKVLSEVGDDLQGGMPIHKALSHHPQVFSKFYVNMIRAGEESGKLSQTFVYLADYLDRTYELVSKAKNALIYPAFVIVVFFGVMGLMLTLVIPKISSVLVDSGQKVPVYTSIIISFSNFLVHYGVFILIALAALGFYIWQLGKTPKGKLVLDKLRIDIPLVGNLYSKLYLSRIADNLSTMLLSGISVVEGLEITSSVVDNADYEKVLSQIAADVKSGSSISDAMDKHNEIPGIMVAMTKVGEETGELGNILTTLAKFYNREVVNAVDTLVGLIEPIMIVMLGVGVGVLLAAILMPIYNLASAI